MTRAITVALLLVTVCAAALALSLHNLALGVIAAISLLLTAVTAAGPGRLVSQCAHLTGRPARLRICGAVPRQLGATDVVVDRVWALGAGLHFRVTLGSASSVHIKVAQPRRWAVGPDTLAIADAKYVQIAGVTVARVAGCPAMQLFVHAASRSHFI
jgi:hypothetical protein